MVKVAESGDLFFLASRALRSARISDRLRGDGASATRRNFSLARFDSKAAAVTMVGLIEQVGSGYCCLPGTEHVAVCVAVMTRGDTTLAVLVIVAMVFVYVLVTLRGSTVTVGDYGGFSIQVHRRSTQIRDSRLLGWTKALSPQLSKCL